MKYFCQETIFVQVIQILTSRALNVFATDGCVTSERKRSSYRENPSLCVIKKCWQLRENVSESILFGTTKRMF